MWVGGVGLAEVDVVGVGVAFAVVELLHQARGGVAQVQGDGIVARGAHVLGNGGVGGVERVALGRGGEVDDGLGEGEAAFGHADEVDRLLRGDADEQRLRIGHADVFAGEADQAAHDVERVFARFEHAREPVERGVGVGAAQ